MFLPEAFSTEPWAGSTTRTVDCWMGPRNLSWYRSCRLKELQKGSPFITVAPPTLDVNLQEEGC